MAISTLADRQASGCRHRVGQQHNRTGFPATVFALPLALTLGLWLVSLTPRVQGNPVLVHTLWAVSAGLLLWQGLLFVQLRRTRSGCGFLLRLRRQHWVQALVQTSVYLYWGFYWQPVYQHCWLLIAQILFAYVFDMLLAWSRQRDYLLGFGPVPIILSINLFLWFRDDWFYLQFVMIAMGLLGKEYVRWQREGRSVHIFNPSAFALGIFSVLLIATDTSALTWGQQIASTLTLAPNIYTFLFLVGLVVMYCFAITLVAGMAAITLFLLSGIWFATTGVPYFLDSDIPAAVFLGLHLLVTDPSTSPRTPLGKLLFGLLYGSGVFVLYTLLGVLGAPVFYDKLLCVPLLNLAVPAIDRLVRSLRSSSLSRLWQPRWWNGRANLAHMSLWILWFGMMSVLGKTDGRHTGDSLPFWQQACAQQLPNGCQRLLQLQASYCADNSAWACNELGAHYREGVMEGVMAAADEELAWAYFARACELKFKAACVNLLDSQAIIRDNPHELDLRLLLREGGQNLLELPIHQLYARACEHDWAFACEAAT